jgi:myo-inositol-1(or 4)-monophosphatase
VRRLGSAALDLAYVAAGRYDGFWERGLSPWDMAAGLCILREAGGLAGGLGEGDPMDTGDVIAANAEIYETFRKLLVA